MVQKACSDCGCLCYETEERCWSCRGGNFSVLPGTEPEDRTLSLGEASDQTLSWMSHRRPQAGLAYLAAGVGFAFFAGMLGYWLGRASAPAPPPVSPVVVSPLRLPTPPTALRAAPDPASDPLPLTTPLPPAPRPAYSDSAQVTVRSSPPRRRSPPPTAALPAFEPQMPLVQAGSGAGFANPRPAHAAPPVSVARDPAAAAPAAPAPLVLQPSPTHAVVQLFNGDLAPVEVTVGSDTRIRIAPGDGFPLLLKPGTYAVRVSGAGAMSGPANLSVLANRSYPLVVNRQREEGKESLVLVEPAGD